MLCLSPRLLHFAASSVFLFAFNLSVAPAAEHLRREPTWSHWSWKSGRYTREINHGYIHYPGVTYWASGDLVNSVDRWDATDIPAYGDADITPSPWAYHSIAPYRHQYHSFNGTGYCYGECSDCRN